MKLPVLIPLLFIATSFVAAYLFYRSSQRKKIVLIIMTSWIAVQTVLSLTDFFTVTNTMPPRFALLVLPPLALLIFLLATSKGRTFLDGFDTGCLTLVHVLRIPVEITLYLLFIQKAMPELMTFEGRNFDLFSGITAGLVYYFGYVKRKLSTTLLLVWNFVVLGILLFTVTNGILSAPTPFQTFAFDQPNIAVLHFPFTLLPGLVVPIVYFGHIITIRNLLSLDAKAQRRPSLKGGEFHLANHDVIASELVESKILLKNKT